MSCDVDHGCGSDLVLLWLWGRPLAWELLYAASVALKRKKKIENGENGNAYPTRLLWGLNGLIVKCHVHSKCMLNITCNYSSFAWNQKYRKGRVWPFRALLDGSPRKRGQNEDPGDMRKRKHMDAKSGCRRPPDPLHPSSVV